MGVVGSLGIIIQNLILPGKDIEAFCILIPEIIGLNNIFL